MKLAVKILKAFGIIVCVALVLLVVLYLLVFAYTYYSFRTSHWTTGPDEAGFWYYYWDGLHKTASVVRCDVDPSHGHTEITIPESYGEYPVEELGGQVGKGWSPFNVEFDNIKTTASVVPSEGSFLWYTEKRSLEIVYVDLRLQIGSGIRRILAQQGGLEAGTKLYVPRMYITCDPDNRRFYSENGRLYDKEGELVDGFFWWDEEYGG